MDSYSRSFSDEELASLEEVQDDDDTNGVTSVVNISDQMLAEILALRSDVDRMHASIELIRDAQVHQGVALAELTGLCRERGRLCGVMSYDRLQKTSSGRNGK